MKTTPLNTDIDGNASTILAGYYKYGVATLMLGNYGTSGTIILEAYESPIGAESAEELRQG
jgi:hypothetical protein